MRVTEKQQNSSVHCREARESLHASQRNNRISLCITEMFLQVSVITLVSYSFLVMLILNNEAVVWLLLIEKTLPWIVLQQSNNSMHKWQIHWVIKTANISVQVLKASSCLQWDTRENREREVIVLTQNHNCRGCNAARHNKISNWINCNSNSSVKPASEFVLESDAIAHTWYCNKQHQKHARIVSIR